MTENRSAATAPVESPQQNEAMAPQQQAPAPPPVAERIPTERSEVSAPRQETPAPPVAEEQHIGEQRNQATAAQQETSPPPVVDIPVSAYAADGTRRTIVIRPTSIQDVYYYSAPR